jgi:glycosyltransferase involved in cell wall biosynthesis
MRDALPERQILGALSMCDAIVLPYTEARSTANLRSTSASLMDVLEAGAPAVATRTRSMADFVEDGVNGLLVPAGDVPALTAALRRLRDEPQLAGRLRVGAQAARQNLAEAGDPGRAALSCYLRHLADVDRRA